MSIEINGNLYDIKNYKNFENNIMSVYSIFNDYFGMDIMNKIDLYVDNATENSGYTPIITPVFRKYLIIKLGITDFSKSEQIVFQFAHELCHYVFYSMLGLNKDFANREEENICSAMSLVVIKMLFPDKFSFWKRYVSSLIDKNYHGGLEVAESVHYSLEQLKNKILQICEQKTSVSV